MNGLLNVARNVAYRLGQGCQQLGFVPPLSQEDGAEVARWLPSSALPLFRGMSHADQQHCLRVCRRLQVQGCDEADMLAAALLHDVGKGEGRVPFWTRPAIVLGKAFAPRLLTRLVSAPCTFELGVRPSEGQVGARINRAPRIDRAPRLSWRRALSYAWFHADVGADLAASAGLSERAVLYIRTHHQPRGPAAALHAVDEVS